MPKGEPIRIRTRPWACKFQWEARVRGIRMLDDVNVYETEAEAIRAARDWVKSLRGREVVVEVMDGWDV